MDDLKVEVQRLQDDASGDEERRVGSDHDHHDASSTTDIEGESDVRLGLLADVGGSALGEDSSDGGVGGAARRADGERVVARVDGCDEDEGVEKALELVEEKLVEQVATIARMSKWSGALPPPEVFARYEPHVQERMMSWNDAATIDESRRQDQLVAAQIDQAKKGPNRALAVCGLAMILGAGTYLVAHDYRVVLAFVSMPVLLFAVNLIQSVASRSSRSARRRTGSTK